MYLSCISFINSIKTASLRWHSPMLDDISVVKTWDKVNQGMIKMYEAEVLGKLPVMQHALFGSLIPFPDDDPELKNAEELPVDAHGHVHVKGETGWTMDCCGIPGESRMPRSAHCPVPSAFAEAQAGTQSTARVGIKPIPFD
jgi:serine/threonine-protein phosphatase 2A activator